MSENRDICTILSRMDNIEKSLDGISKCLAGNGRPGILEVVNKMQVMVQSQEEEIRSIQSSKETDKRLVLSSMLFAVFSMIGAIFSLFTGKGN